ncbi:MAG: TIGR03960 family B12-binding radical SAM protein, partial [Anaerolineales bacterium]
MNKISPEKISETVESILPRVQKPGRYTGGELNQVRKDWDCTSSHVALVFPDIYDLGMSNLGLAILYDILNKRPDVLAERVYSPWTDMENSIREAQIPLYSLETRHALYEFDIVGFSIPYETLYTNVLNILNLGEIPILNVDRTESHPLVIAGGHAAFNPEPMHAFIDAFVIGEGEEVIQDIVNTYQEWKRSNQTRSDLLLKLSGIWGVYVPSLYQAEYHQEGTISGIHTLDHRVPYPVVKRIVPKLPPHVTRLIVPYIDTVHNRIPIEIMRGCTRGCRFCHAGMITRPVRERPVDEILDSIEKSLLQTGYGEIGLLSLSSSDYTHILDLVKKISQRFQADHLKVSLPSLRIESFSVDLMDNLQDSRRGGFTLAPEAATERMRNIINKPVSTKQLLETTSEIFKHGWSKIKLYFMIGHPSETLEDVIAIADLCKAVLKEGRNIIGKRAFVTAGVSTFIPKPHTPFQWVACDSIESITEKQNILRKSLRGRGLKLNWNSPEISMLEAWLSRGDRRISQVILEAWKLGAKFDAWNDHFQFDTWMKAFNNTGLDWRFYTHRERPIDEI